MGILRSYISVINDLDGSHVLEVAKGREGNAASELVTHALDARPREMVCRVCIDMSAPYIKALREHFPHADIIHNKFHISQHLANAVEKTRRIEHARLQKQGDELLTKTTYLWLRGMESLVDEALARLRMLGRCELGGSKDWYLKELFRNFWSRRDKDYAERYLEYYILQRLLGGDQSQDLSHKGQRPRLQELQNYRTRILSFCRKLSLAP